MADNTIKTFTIKVDTKSGELKINGITKSFKEAEIALKQLNEQAKNTTETGLNPLTGATGLAGATITELGRTVSDLNYGFPAVANNISQLGSLFTILTTKANGAAGAFELIKKEMRGPLGILFAFQVGITLIEAISKGFIKLGKDTDALTKAFKDAGKSVSDISGNFEIYINTLQDSNKSQDEQEEAIKRLNKEFPDFVENLKESDLSMQDVKDSTEKATEQIDLQRIAIVKLAKSRAAEKRIQELSTEIINKQVEQQKEAIALGVEGIEVEQLRKEAANISIDEYSEVADAERINRLNALADLKEENEVFIKNKRQEIKLLTDYIEFEEDSRKKSTKSKRGFVARELSFADDILKSEDRIAEKVTKNQFDRLKQEEEVQKKLAQIKFDEYKIREQARVAAIKDPKDRAKAEIKSAEAIKKSEQSLQDFKVQLENETSAKILQIKIEDAVKQLNIVSDLQAKEREAILSFNESMANTELGRIAIQEQLEEERHKNKIKKINDEIKEREREGKLYFDLEQKKKIEEARNQREKTKLTKAGEDARLAIINFAADAAIAIAGKGSAIGKAVAVAMAIINTKKAITAALGDKEVPALLRIIHATAVGAFGFKQVKDIMSTKLPVEAGAGLGAGGGGASLSVEAPDFNVVGTGGASQLASTLAGETRRPIRAFVVSKEMSSAQELDRNISSNAALD